MLSVKLGHVHRFDSIQSAHSECLVFVVTPNYGICPIHNVSILKLITREKDFI